MILFGAHIPNSLKNKIWEGKFIDLSLLVKTASELHDWGSGDIKVKDVRLCIMRPKSNAYPILTSGLQLFFIFVSIMLEKSPTRAEELLKYLRDIGIAATRSNNWSKYDEQFRLRMSNQPQASWGHINQEVWLLYISNKQDTSTMYDSKL